MDNDEILITNFMNTGAIGMLYCTSFNQWSRIMNIVDKIESIEDNKGSYRFNVAIEQCFCNIIDNETSDDIVNIDGDSKIEAVYRAVVEFIKWYNKNK